MLKQLLFLLFLTCIALHSSAQKNVVAGTVKDADTREPLPFVNLVVNSSLKGGISDINGNFVLESEEPIRFIRTSYVGYKTDTIFPKNGRADIFLKKSAIQLGEVIILPGENPAHRIIDSAVAHRKENDPFDLNSFSYSSYTKFFITAELDSLMSIPDEKLDTERLSIKQFFSEYHVFMMENLAERKYLKPSLDNERIVASRVSGFSDPLFTLLMGQIQSFAFYKPLITISDKNYVNPISVGSTSKYFFLLQDTIYDGADTVFVISYRPLKGSGFDGLKGLLYIHSDGWALQCVTAEPSMVEKGMSVRIRQDYFRPDGLNWFPHELHTDILFSNLKINQYPLFGRGITQLYKIKLNPALKKSDFSTAAVSIEPDAKDKDSIFWLKNRPDTLSQKELNTYLFIDSIGKKEHFDRLLDFTTTLMSGYIPVGPLAIDINSIYRYNEAEGSRLGLGLKTSYRVSKKWNLYGYYGYGFRDKKHKFGADLRVELKRSRQSFLKIGYAEDVRENGSTLFENQTEGLLDLAGLRNYLINRIDYYGKAKLSVHSLLGKSWETTASVSRNAFLAPDSVFYGQYNPLGFSGSRSFVSTDASVWFHYSKGQKFVQSEDYSLPIGGYTPYPVIDFEFKQGIPGLAQGNISRTSVMMQLSQTIKTKYIGHFSYLIKSGWVSPDAPFSLAFNSPASYRSFTISAPYSFETMRMNEFYSTRFVYVFLRHSFESIVFGKGRFAPSPELVSSFAFGDFNNRSHIQSPNFKTMNKGYFESGLFINKIINTGLYSLGTGALYRYGPYQLDSFRKNLTIKISLNYAL